MKAWLKWLPPMLAWTPGDYPSVDLNIARLRAKVHGALYMIWRPCLWLAIQTFDRPRAANSPYTTTSPASITEPTTLEGGKSREEMLLDASHDCVQAAIQSTIAFDRVGADPNSEYRDFVSTRKRRLILTNIVGTLHA